ncbi:hypothetical protein SCG7086_BS_00060 [Chlamydiales bacterium SCGC AG-110-P3]|nr:hypothetical protein SCG7086_BS_00060 [Chlamydiales bacterium SCGC AG-110-P3]
MSNNDIKEMNAQTINGPMDDRLIGTSKEAPGFENVVQKGLLDMASDYTDRAQQYYKMAREYNSFSAVAAKEILIVEDNESNSRLVRAMLEKEGFQCSAAATAVDALAYCEKNTPVVVLMDIELPDSDGLQLTKQLRQKPEMKFVPIIAVTAHVNSDTMMKAMEAGCDNFIGKPFTREYFVRIVQQYFERMRA